MPESMSVERRKLLKVFGAKLVLTPAKDGMKGSINEADRIIQENKDHIMLDQFSNNANPEIHKKTTALEIWEDMAHDIDIFIAGVGTGGTITGVGEVLKKLNPNIKIIAVEPIDSSVISGEKPGPHKIQGIGAGFIPKNLNVNVIDKVIKISNEEAFNTSKILAKTEGIFCGISSGASLIATIKISEREENKGKKIVVILPDTGERYLSTELI